MVKVVLGIAILLGAVLILADEPEILTSTSPDKKYTVRLIGKSSRPKVPIVWHSVYFDLLRNGEPVFRKRKIHSGDWRDAGFDDFYTNHYWLTNSVIRFSRKGVSEHERDLLTVSNKTNKPVSYLRVQSVDLFLLFDLPPHSKTQVLAYPQTGLSWITVDGQFADQTIIPEKGTNFSIEREQKGPFQYDISINNNGATIRSPQLNEYVPQRFNGPW